jgi:hypothetical protein
VFPVEGQAVHPTAAFVSAILDGVLNIASVQDAANVVALIQSAYHSTANRRLIQIEEI